MYSLMEIVSTIGLIVLIYMTAWFVLAVMLKRRDVIDSAWGLGFVLTAWIAYMLRNNETSYTFIAALLVSLWGVRLFWHISTRNWKKREDYRYAQMGALTSFRMWLRTYVSLFLLQGLLMIAISSPVIAIMFASDKTPTAVLATVGTGLWLASIVFEAVADYQLRRFITTKQKGIMQSGLWRYSRHPNYFGEISAWWSAALVAAAFGQWWGIAGALVITTLIVKISGVPLLEKRYANDADYQEYAQRTSKLVPLPPKGLKSA